MTDIRVSEHFYSVQGEGVTMGIPAVFLRLQNCNLLCEWPCDTIEVWKKGTKYTVKQLQDLFYEQGYIQKLQDGAHLVITGGEPLLQQEALIEFLYGSMFYIEIETNGTIAMNDKLNEWIDQINCSPKLKSSGVNQNLRFKPQVLKQFSQKKNSWFKFVIYNEQDIQEILTYDLPHDKIILMPQATTKKELNINAPRAIELAKKYGFRYSDRLHLRIWDKATGV